MKKYDEDLNTTLIFVSSIYSSGLMVRMYSFASQAGLFSAVTSAFVLDVQSQLQPDTGEETAALLRVLIDKIDNTTFGGDTPTLPQWAGPPHAIVQIQAILYASLAVSLLSAFLAMLGKQWLNRYVLTDMRGTTIERCQNRQRKLDGIVAWYFDHVMEALPLMLQIALLLLGCALSRYLWEINIAVASVVVGVTSFGVAFYAFIVVAGTVSESCPYQTPGARILRHILPPIHPVFVSSNCYLFFVELYAKSFSPGADSSDKMTCILLFLPCMLIAAALDTYRLGLAIHRLLAALGKMVYGWVTGTSHRPCTSDQQTIVLGLRCVSWMLQTSFDKAVHLSALKHLATMVTLAEFSPVIVADCLDVFLSCVNIRTDTATIIHGSEQLAAVSAVCFFRSLRRLLATDPTSTVLEDVARQSCRDGYQYSSLRRGIWRISDLIQRFLRLQSSNHGAFAQEPIPVTRYIVEAAQVEYQHTGHRKVPRWILRLALDSLSLDPLPPTSVVADYLSTIAIDLDCDVTGIEFIASDERCVPFLQMAAILTLNQCSSGPSFWTDNSETQNDG